MGSWSVRRRPSDVAAGQPLVTILTPSYNQAAFLIDTLQSVAAQDYPRIEHIIIDGGSSDGSTDLLAEWATSHDIVWSSGPDAGQADAINKGAAVAGGDIITWLNSDDVYLDRSVVSDVVRLFVDGADFVTGGGWYLDEAGHREEIIPVYPERIDLATLRYVDWILQPATFVRRNLFLRCPLDTSLHFAFDWDHYLRLAELATPTPIYRDIAGYRRHQTAKTVSGGSRRQRELLEVTRRHQGRFSRGFLELLPFVAAHWAVERAPYGIRGRVVGAMNWVAEYTRRLTHGRGVPY